ncbi:MAG: lipocalin-like domain-containing protein [Tannerellaceae bacterium]|jgi:hypothetical protein|nr:lipocalin-like domain-containing protein [Tannerellaceae bacterium]
MKLMILVGKERHFMLKTGCLAVILCILAACGNDIEDHLEGKWQLQQVETDGIVQNVDTIFYNFQTSLFMYQVYIPSLELFYYSYGFKDIDDTRLSLEILDQFLLPYTDWESTKRTFMIEQSSQSRLVLSSGSKRYTFRKF